MTKKELAKEWRHGNHPMTSSEDYLADKAFIAGYDAGFRKAANLLRTKKFSEFWKSVDAINGNGIANWLEKEMKK